MYRRNLLDRLNAGWSALCIWFLRISPLPTEQSLRLITRISMAAGLTCPCPVRVRK